MTFVPAIVLSDTTPGTVHAVESNMFLFHILVLLSWCGGIFCSSCSSAKDCITCVSKDSWVPFISVKCRWCSLSRECHEFGSFINPCPHGKSATKTSQCYEKPTGEYDPENAYLNVLLSAVAYSDHPQKCMDQLLPRGGFEVIKVIGRKCNRFLFEYNECFAIVAVSEYSKVIAVAFRGTTSSQQLAEEILQVLYQKKRFAPGGEVYEYFYDAYSKLYPCAKETVENLLVSMPSYDVVITGHSLGGAMASLTALSLVYERAIRTDQMSLYTYGMPRTGDTAYALAHDELVNNSWRVIHYKDVVPRLPSRLVPAGDLQPYHHRTEIYYPQEQMRPNSSYVVCTSNEDPDCANSHTLNPLNIREYIQYHLRYFDIHVGKACSNLGARDRRSDDDSEISAMSHLFSNETCRVIDLDDDEVSEGYKTTEYKLPLIMVLIATSTIAYPCW